MAVWLRHKSFPIPSTNISLLPDPVVQTRFSFSLSCKGEEAAYLHGEDDDAIHVLPPAALLEK